MKTSKLNKVLALGLLISLWIPIIVNHSGLFKKLFVHGVSEEDKVEHPSWLTGTAQQEFENELMANSVSKTYLLRICNQFQYSLFHKINAADIYESNGMMFRFYHYGFNEDSNFVGEDSLKHTVAAIKTLQDQLGKEIPIITIIAPSKSHYYKQYLEPQNRTKTNNTNYKHLLKYLADEKLNVIDFNDYFLKHPSTTPAIFANGGIHWTHYGATIAMDSVQRLVSHLKGIQYNQFTYSTSDCKGFNVDDLDIGLMRNLMTKPYDENLREVTIHSKNNGPKIKTVIVSDSFYTLIFYSPLRKAMFTDSSNFNYYFNTTFTTSGEMYPVNIQKIKAELKDADCIIIMSELVNLEKFGFGFPQAMIK